ncbi:LysM peptidoglycan-binding domain-containing protein [Prauserella oleivorans]|uniref:LysM peptidoglycan-binding domain-containing protein n=1 Tax=Prauserella oleivorans TaxID=1478153 RepID=UPI00361C7AB5
MSPRWPAFGAVAVVVFLGVVGLGLFAGALADTGGSAVPADTAVVSVRAGDTLWDVAERTAPGSEPAAVVERIRELNGLTGALVEPGTPLVVPAGN